MRHTQILTVEFGLLQRLDLADVDVLHWVDALHSLQDFPGDVFGDAAVSVFGSTKKTAVEAVSWGKSNVAHTHARNNPHTSNGEQHAKNDSHQHV